MRNISLRERPGLWLIVSGWLWCLLALVTLWLGDTLGFSDPRPFGLGMLTGGVVIGGIGLGIVLREP